MLAASSFHRPLPGTVMLPQSMTVEVGNQKQSTTPANAPFMEVGFLAGNSHPGGGQR